MPILMFYIFEVVLSFIGNSKAVYIGLLHILHYKFGLTNKRPVIWISVIVLRILHGFGFYIEPHKLKDYFLVGVSHRTRKRNE